MTPPTDPARAAAERVVNAWVDEQEPDEGLLRRRTLRARMPLGGLFEADLQRLIDRIAAYAAEQVRAEREAIADRIEHMAFEPESMSQRRRWCVQVAAALRGRGGEMT